MWSRVQIYEIGYGQTDEETLVSARRDLFANAT